MLIAALLTVAPNQKKPRRPSVGKYLQKLVQPIPWNRTTQ